MHVCTMNLASEINEDDDDDENDENDDDDDDDIKALCFADFSAESVC